MNDSKLKKFNESDYYFIDSSRKLYFKSFNTDKLAPIKDSDQVIKEADPATFRVIPEDSGFSNELLRRFSFLIYNGYSSWACDKNNLYFCEDIYLKGPIDQQTTRVIGFDILLDKTHVFYNRRIVKDANPEQFQCIVNLTKGNDADRIKFFTSFFKDGNNIFYLYEGEKSETDKYIVRCSIDNRKMYRDELQTLLDNSTDYNLEAEDIAKINKLLKN